jgi:lactoylglutathione lyase
MKQLNIIFTFAVIFLSMNHSTAQTTQETEPATLNHIAVYVSNLDKSASFYETLLNLKKIEEPFKDGRHVWFSLGTAGQMHLIQGAKTGVEHDKNEHLCFSVSSITDFLTKLDQQNISYINWAGTAKTPTVRVDGVKQIYFQDPDGHWIEVNDQKKFE